MARLIVKSPYIQCGKQNASGYLCYIATRERVEIIPDDRPPTRKQKQLITKLTKDFPDVKELLEYEDYTTHPTKANASSLITLVRPCVAWLGTRQGPSPFQGFRTNLGQF